ncbi:testis-expressed protein 9-like isoform X2 [Pocillopora verrucosa]|uniref:testis-expressed protein 9-like isoform X2 n=1 Tax=Pocillopora verrucosa TaxID=203993 RepID=UPI003341D697
MEKPPSGKTKNIAQGLLSKEEEYTRLNAELEERTASLIKEAEEVMHDQDELFSRPTATEVELSENLEDLLPLMDFSNVDIPSSSVLKQKPVGSNTTMTQTRPVSSAAGKQGSRPTSRTKKTRPKSKTASAPGSVPHTPVPSDDLIDMLQDRITLANTISTLENEAQDNNYTTTTTDNSVLPVGAEEMGSDGSQIFCRMRKNQQ